MYFAVALPAFIQEADVRDKGDRPTFIEIIPDAATVRERLAQSIRETKLLRHQLRVAEKAARERQQRREVAGVRS